MTCAAELGLRPVPAAGQSDLLGVRASSGPGPSGRGWVMGSFGGGIDPIPPRLGVSAGLFVY